MEAERRSRIIRQDEIFQNKLIEDEQEKRKVELLAASRKVELEAKQRVAEEQTRENLAVKQEQL